MHCNVYEYTLGFFKAQPKFYLYTFFVCYLVGINTAPQKLRPRSAESFHKRVVSSWQLAVGSW